MFSVTKISNNKNELQVNEYVNLRTWRLERFALEGRGFVLPDVVLLVSPAYHGWNTGSGRHDPDDGHIHHGSPGRPLVAIPDWKHGCREPIRGDSTEIPY